MSSDSRSRSAAPSYGVAVAAGARWQPGQRSERQQRVGAHCGVHDCVRTPCPHVTHMRALTRSQHTCSSWMWLLARV
jgi:hypothetical protein